MCGARTFDSNCGNRKTGPASRVLAVTEARVRVLYAPYTRQRSRVTLRSATVPTVSREHDTPALCLWVERKNPHQSMSVLRHSTDAWNGMSTKEATARCRDSADDGAPSTPSQAPTHVVVAASATCLISASLSRPVVHTSTVNTRRLSTNCVWPARFSAPTRSGARNVPIASSNLR